MHASLKIDDSILMLNDEFPEWGSLSPLSTAGSGVIIHFYTDNVDAAFDRALSAGAQVKMPLMDQFWGAVTDWWPIRTDTSGRWRNILRIRHRKKCSAGMDDAMAKMPPAPRAKNGLSREQNSQIAQIVSGGTGDDGVA